MKKILSAAVASIALISAPSVSAQTFATTAGTYTFSGSGVSVQKGSGPLLSCTLSIDITNDGAGNITADNASLTGSFGFCNTVVFQSSPWTVTNPSPGVWSVNGIYVDTTITNGDCSGYLDATFSLSGTTEQLSVDTGFTTTSTLPEVTAGTGDCKIDGTITWP
ncbi:hypothetical protein [Sphingomonas koreensis]|uniref:hypothetical protein n=1 Tax=Sphingomonas koreensis TaxID=93064 RepID=UPI000A61A70B|nr:hypothetical protein [Sphingomonas koreensis]